jgi:hypothetical protein
MWKIEQHRELTQITTRQDTALGIMRWGENNSFPQTFLNLIEQSPSAKPAVTRTASFLKGGEFKGDDTVINPQGLTLKQLVSHMADDYARFEAFAVVCNYNLQGKIVSMYPMSIAELRLNEFDELGYASKIGYHENFGLNSVVKKMIVNTVTKDKIKWIDRFNPNVVKEQIKKCEGGIANYKGQILYYSKNGHSKYPTPPLQAQVNFLLADVENSILMRKESSTGFINTYLLKTSLGSEDVALTELQEALQEAQGARGAGKVIVMPDVNPETIHAHVLEEFGSGASGNSVMDNIKKSFELSNRVINGAYLIPPILAGADQKTGFSAPDLKSAYFVFNSQTQEGRNTIESELNKILKNSVFQTKSISINKLKLDEEEMLMGSEAVPNAAPPKAEPKKEKKVEPKEKKE